MLLDFSIAGHSVPWSFRDSGRLRRMLCERRYREEGGIVGVRAGSDVVADLFTDSLCKELQVQNDFAPAVEISRVRGGGREERLREFLGRHCMVGDGLRNVEWLEIVSRDVATRGLALVLRTDSSLTSLRHWRNESEELVSNLRKTSEGAWVSAFLVSGTDDTDEPGDLDFSIGEPLSDASWMNGPELGAWQAYVHHRIAWEVGGRAEAALSWSEESEGTLKCGDEAGLETALSAHASRRWAAVEARTRNELKAYVTLATSAAWSDRMAAEKRETDLSRQGLLWRPQGMHAVHVVPWAARAMLLGGLNPPVCILLRAELIPPSVTGMALAQCLALEARQRSTFRPPGDPSDEWTQKFSDICARTQRTEGEFYPHGFPGLPPDAWSIASLGDVVQACSASLPKDRKDRLHQLRRLRNALAHGHPCSWKAIEQLRTLGWQLA